MLNTLQLKTFTFDTDKRAYFIKTIPDITAPNIASIVILYLVLKLKKYTESLIGSLFDITLFVSIA